MRPYLLRPHDAKTRCGRGVALMRYIQQPRLPANLDMLRHDETEIQMLASFLLYPCNNRLRCNRKRIGTAMVSTQPITKVL
jgi:hypothetical protein